LITSPWRRSFEKRQTDCYSGAGHLPATIKPKIVRQCIMSWRFAAGSKINTSPNDYFPVEQMQMSKFNGEYSEQFGPVISGEIKKK
jgi:hypothetical protein